MNNTGFTPTHQSSSIFPPLSSETSSTSENPLVWTNTTFAIRDDSECSSSSPPAGYGTTTTPYPTTVKTEDSTAFNISWGGDDKPPCELFPPDHANEEPVKLSRPLPKPRGIRKLPEPEPLEDGTIDQDTLKRRKVTQET